MMSIEEFKTLEGEAQNVVDQFVTENRITSSQIQTMVYCTDERTEVTLWRLGCGFLSFCISLTGTPYLSQLNYSPFVGFKVLRNTLIVYFILELLASLVSLAHTAFRETIAVRHGKIWRNLGFDLSAHTAEVDFPGKTIEKLQRSEAVINDKKKVKPLFSRFATLYPFGCISKVKHPLKKLGTKFLFHIGLSVATMGIAFLLSGRIEQLHFQKPVGAFYAIIGIVLCVFTERKYLAITKQAYNELMEENGLPYRKN